MNRPILGASVMEDVFDVSLPDGTVITGVPRGTTRDQLIGKLQKHGYDVSSLIRQTAAENVTKEMGSGQRFAAAYGGAIPRLVQGIEQRAGYVAPEEVRET